VSLYAKYIKEREDFEIIEDEKGFVTFFFNESSVFVRDLYIAEEHRGFEVLLDLSNRLETLVQERGFKLLIGQVVPSMKGATRSMKALLKLGYEIHSSDNEKIVMVKEL
jgi:hypothetical protein